MKLLIDNIKEIFANARLTQIPKRIQIRFERHSIGTSFPVYENIMKRLLQFLRGSQCSLAISLSVNNFSALSGMVMDPAQYSSGSNRPYLKSISFRIKHEKSPSPPWMVFDFAHFNPICYQVMPHLIRIIHLKGQS